MNVAEMHQKLNEIALTEFEARRELVNYASNAEALNAALRDELAKSQARVAELENEVEQMGYEMKELGDDCCGNC